jgi:hypothetical protein
MPDWIRLPYPNLPPNHPQTYTELLAEGFNFNIKHFLYPLQSFL